MECRLNKETTEMQVIRGQIRRLGLQHQAEEIRQASPYSDDITSHIHLYNELQFYYSLRLQESHITRPSIIKDIDFDLWIAAEGCTNRELMQRGGAPYAFDAPEGKIELHHIGQDYHAPFAELTIEEHDNNSKLLHYSSDSSWRNNAALSKAFLAERSAYWKKRAKGGYDVSAIQFTGLQTYQYQNHQDYMAELRETCEEIYSQCSVENLDYLSDLAKSYAMMRRVGATTMREFLQNSRDALQTKVQCTACKSSDCVLCGSYPAQGEKVQRYKCKSCGKVFSPTSRTLISGSSFSFQSWIKFIDCLYNGYTLKQIAATCNISEKTAHENRTKLFYALKLLNDRVRLQGNVVIDETYLPVSFKGNHANQDDFVMPRAANKRGGENHKRGITDNLACIVCAIDDTGNSVAKVAGTGIATAAKLKFVLQGHLSDEISCLYSDKSPVIKAFAESCGYEIKQEKLLRKNARRTAGVAPSRETFVINRYLQIVNSYHSRLKRFLDRFAGISTKYLSGYLDLFAWKERSKDRESSEAYKELLLVMTEPNNYLSTDDILNGGHLPDAIKVDKSYRKRPNPYLERDKEIYRRFAAGETMTAIGKDYGMTRQNISLIIQSLRRQGMAYKTVKDIEKERPTGISPLRSISKSALARLIRDYQIYAERQRWTGTPQEFKRSMAEKFNLSEHSVQSIVSRMKRIMRLKEEIFIHEDISYRSLEEVYRSIYADFLTLQAEQPNLALNAYAVKLCEKHGFSVGNITRIINIMSIEDLTDYFTKKHRLTFEEAHNRDKAIFIDYLRWNGTQKDFYTHAAEKYGLSRTYVSEIIQYCRFADPKRYDIV